VLHSCGKHGKLECCRQGPRTLSDLLSEWALGIDPPFSTPHRQRSREGFPAKRVQAVISTPHTALPGGLHGTASNRLENPARRIPEPQLVQARDNLPPAPGPSQYDAEPYRRPPSQDGIGRDQSKPAPRFPRSRGRDGSSANSKKGPDRTGCTFYGTCRPPEPLAETCSAWLARPAEGGRLTQALHDLGLALDPGAGSGARNPWTPATAQLAALIDHVCLCRHAMGARRSGLRVLARRV